MGMEAVDVLMAIIIIGTSEYKTKVTDWNIIESFDDIFYLRFTGESLGSEVIEDLTNARFVVDVCDCKLEVY